MGLKEIQDATDSEFNAIGCMGEFEHLLEQIGTCRNKDREKSLIKLALKEKDRFILFLNDALVSAMNNNNL